jgi:peroxiredoxin Q/BCP
MSLSVGDKAPDFDLETQNGDRISLVSLRGRRVVLYWYPRDDTPGCTTEACGFRDNLNRLASRDVVLLGASPDSAKSHKKFAEKFSLGFPLLADTDTSVAQAYGVWVEKSMYGRKYMGIERTTFAIDENGIITHIWPKVKVNGHVDEVMEALGL